MGLVVSLSINIFRPRIEPHGTRGGSNRREEADRRENRRAPRISSLASFPTVFKVAALTAVVINIFDFLLASPAALKEYPELLSKGGSGVRAACFVGGMVIAAMPSTTLRWRLTLTAQLSLVKLIPAAILAYRMRDDGLIFAVGYYADRMTFLLGFGLMYTVTNYTSGLNKQLAESDRRVAELEEARRDSIAREFFARHSPGVAPLTPEPD